LCKVYGYCRVALASKEEIAEQMRAIANYCEGNNLKVDGFFCDDGISGFDIGPEFKHLLGELKSGDTVIIKDIARLTRSNERLLMLMGQLDYMGVKIICVNGNEVNTSAMREWLNTRWAK
jgi:DNA invertase Pin-like site-specific DNA recombinase